MACRAVRRRGRGGHARRRSGARARGHPRAGAGARRGPRARHRRPRGVRPRLHRSRAPGRRAVRGPIPAGDGAGASARGEAPRGDRGHGTRHGCRARLPRQGQRSGPPGRLCAIHRSRHQGHRAGARVGHDTASGLRVRDGKEPSRAPRQRQPLQHRRESLGAFNRVRSTRGPVGRAAGRHLHAHARAEGLPRRGGLRRHRVRGRRPAAGQRHRDGNARAPREPRHHCRIARCRAHRHGREPPGRNQVARGVRSAGRCPAAHGTPRAREAGDRPGSRAHQARPRAPVRGSSSTTASGSPRRARRSTRSSARSSRG